jgi:N-acetylmuramoyl-L-alanine amidase
MKYNDKGKAVRDMQLALMGQGYELPKYGADGHLGNETMAALKAFMTNSNIGWPAVSGDEVPQEALAALVINGMDPEVLPVPDQELGDVKLYDLRGEPWSERNQKKFKRSGGMAVVRDPKMVTGITVHQTAVKYGVKDYQIHAAGGDAELALARRSLKVACHVMAFHDGFIAAPNPLAWYVYHGNGFNAYELGIEIDGNYPGVIGGKVWNSNRGGRPTQVTVPLVRAAQAGIEFLVREGRKLGMPIEHIHAHRQSSATRRSDPGEELWKRVVLEYAVQVLGLIPHQAEVLKDGRPVPIEWDTTGVGSY